MNVIVTQLRRADHGELDAHISIGNGAVPVTRRYGSWSTMPDAAGRTRDILAEYAARLQRAARRYERRERRCAA